LRWRFGVGRIRELPRRDCPSSSKHSLAAPMAFVSGQSPGVGSSLSHWICPVRVAGSRPCWKHDLFIDDRSPGDRKLVGRLAQSALRVLCPQIIAFNDDQLPYATASPVYINFN
jgi:hypothetical protein